MKNHSGVQNMEKSIFLKDIWPIDNVENYKIHFGRKYTDPEGNEFEPLDEWVSNRLIWQNWQEYRPQRDEFNRDYIYSLMNFYHDSDTWLFGGIFKVIGRPADRYEVKLIENGKEFVGRLNLRLQYRDRATRVNFENHYHKFEVSEILREPYTGRVFRG